MDRVSRILREREEHLPKLAPWAVLAIGLHAAAIGAALWVSQIEPVRPPHLPGVSVRLVRPDLPAGRKSGGTRSQRKPPAAKPVEPKPSKQPEHRIETKPEKEVVKPSVPSPSESAMPAAETQPAAPTPEPVTAGSEQAGPPGPPSGLSLGQGSGGGQPAIPADFQFTYYVDRMLALIESKWYKPPVPAGTHARVRFIISGNGRLDRIELEKSSGIPSFDRAVLRSLYAANPLPPLPPAYRKPSLTVHLTFSE